MELGQTFYTDFIISDPTTGAVTDADSLPDVDVFEDDDDTPILNIVSVKRVGHTGNYRVKVDATTDNGFEKEKSYSMVANATVAGIVGKAVINNFILNNTMEILLDVARSLNSGAIPESFVIDYAVEKPLEVFSPEVVFGAASDYEFRDWFIRYYDVNLEVWKDGDSGVVDAEIKAAVLLQQESFNDYLNALNEWTLGYNTQREMEYRKYLAQILIDVCTP